MQYSIRKLALATVLVASAGAVVAQQQPHARDSVYADPTRAVSPSRVTAYSMTEARFGRDTVYATALPTPSSPIVADVTRLQRHGRGSVYAIELDPAQDTGATRIGRAPSGGSTN
jgi:hypothetical protein